MMSGVKSENCLSSRIGGTYRGRRRKKKEETSLHERFLPPPTQKTPTPAGRQDRALVLRVTDIIQTAVERV